MIPVADDERKRRPQRTAVAQAGEHLDAILLELLPRAAAVASLPSAEVVVDRVAVEHEAGGKAAHDRDERWPVRLAGGFQLEAHACKRRRQVRRYWPPSHHVDRRGHTGPELERGGSLGDEDFQALR